MANNRLYLVDTETKEYCCFAKCVNFGWSFGNDKIFNKFLGEMCGLDSKTTLLIGSENDTDFYEKWIKEGINVNENNTWEYYNS